MFNPSIYDVNGRLKMSRAQNIYDADFEYGLQPLRWEAFAAGGGTVVPVPREGGCRLSLPTTANAVIVRQSRPYHRYQPGKSLYMASAVQFGPPVTNQLQRVGFFDDGNGAFFEEDQTGMNVVIRNDILGMPTDTRVPQANWNGDKRIANSLDWTRIQMVWLEYAWYGAGAVRFGVILDGMPHVLHTFGQGNAPGALRPWARTGNLPVRYEIRNTGTAGAASIMMHWGVSVVIEGGSDPQRGFTYTYGTAPGIRRTVAANVSRFPVTSFRLRPMAVILEDSTATGGSTTTLVRTGAGWTVNQWQGMYLLTTGGTGANQMARIVSNTADTLTLQNNVTLGGLLTALASGTTYQIGYPSRGQLLPRRLVISTTALCTVELVQNPTAVTGVTWVNLSALGSANSFAQRDIAGTAITGGEVVYAFTAPAGGSGLLTLELDELFPLFNNIRGENPDILSVCVTTPAGAGSDVAAHVVCQEAMS
jgi:hypothetical protein